MVEEHDKLLPIANVGRIMKHILPRNAKISKEAKETMQECVSEFISFVTSEASDKCHKENRKTVNGDDICWALSSLGFDNFSEFMLRYLHKFREYERHKAEQNKASSSEDKDEVTSYGVGLQPDTSAPIFEFQILDKGGSSSSANLK
ncbi:Nuclear transcription factor Y subunit B-4 [Abeliophyllum distichum]|uniref:Nuclear transcription factor Y subunit B-4 n=1 Tax=Abeliophyllum distichum TaxID=126358 RepID=A0ABD1R039_9LAMI